MILKVFFPLQIHWPASSTRKGECQMTGKGRQVGLSVHILFFQKPSFRTAMFEYRFSPLSRANAPTLCDWLSRGTAPTSTPVEREHTNPSARSSAGVGGQRWNGHLQLPEWDLQQKSPGSIDLESCSLLNISGLQTGTLICLWFCSAPSLHLNGLFICIVCVQSEEMKRNKIKGLSDFI